MSDYYQRGEMLMKVRRFHEAREQFLCAVSEDPDDAWSYSRLGVCCYHLGDHNAALDHLRSAVSMAPEEPGLHHNLAWFYCHIGRSRTALKVARRALASHPTYLPTILLLAGLYYDLGNRRQAAAHANRALTIDPNCGDAHWILGIVAQQQGKMESAVEKLAAALREEPESPHAHASMGWGCLHRGKLPEAEFHFKEALRRDPRSEGARRGLLEVLMNRAVPYRWIAVYQRWLGRWGAGLPIVLGVLIAGLCWTASFWLGLKEHDEMLLVSILPLLGIYGATGWFAMPMAVARVSLAPEGKRITTSWEKYGSFVLIAIFVSSLALLALAWIQKEYGLWVVGLVMSYAFLPLLHLWGNPERAFRLGRVLIPLVALFGTLFSWNWRLATFTSDEKGLATGILALCFTTFLLSIALPIYLKHRKKPISRLY